MFHASHATAKGDGLDMVAVLRPDTLSVYCSICGTLCREQLLLDEVSCEEHDQSVSILITENTIYR